MLYDSTIVAEIGNRLHQSNNPLIASHIRPDGDAIGSLVGLGLILEKAGKSPRMILSDGLPAKYRFLAGSEKIVTDFKDDYDLAIALDCADPGRLGDKFIGLSFDINIDHHVTNTGFADINLVIPEKTATSQMLAEIAPMINFELDNDSASALLMGIITDSIGFRTSNVTPETMKTAAKLMKKGANVSSIYQDALITQSFEAGKLWGFALSRMVREEEILWTSILLEDRKMTGYTGRDDADLTNVLSTIKDARVAILFNEQPKGKVKVSWRSGSDVDVSEIAVSFGGGGHPPAAGAELDGNLVAVQEIVLDRTRQFLGE
jgi:phosphoesterase RecJ-like protein